jgi:hypothetical protein
MLEPFLTGLNMYDREFEANPEMKARQSRRVDERKKETPNTPPHDLLAQAADRHGDHSSPATSAAMLNSVAAAQPARAGQSLLRLQRQYGNRYVQRVLMLARKADGDAQLSPETEEIIHRSRGGGRPLGDNVRGQMESAIGADFRGVRVHADAQADTLSRAVNARAFTVGQDVYFRQGAYEPGSSSGRELLAHERTHVVQQSGGGVQRKLTVSQPGDKYEQEADHVAQAVTRMEQSAVANPAATPPLQRQAEEEKKDETVQTKAEPGSLQRQPEEETADENM